jgi:hypothetical protein
MSLAPAKNSLHSQLGASFWHYYFFIHLFLFGLFLAEGFKAAVLIFLNKAQ